MKCMPINYTATQPTGCWGFVSWHVYQLQTVHSNCGARSNQIMAIWFVMVCTDVQENLAAAMFVDKANKIKLQEGISFSEKWRFQESRVFLLGTAVAQWLRCCATNRKVAGSSPDGFIGIFH